MFVNCTSGFHYGIYTCESCKGFFKRTVQNKKSFVCPRNGECEIVLENRKKCPACRFAKCLVMGMKLEGIKKIVIVQCKSFSFLIFFVC